MQYIVENGPARFGTDLPLTLTPEQSAPRARKLAKVLGDDGEPVENKFLPTEIVEFKTGEVIGIDLPPGHLPGTLGGVLKPKGSDLTAAEIKSKIKPRRKAASGTGARNKRASRAKTKAAS